MIAPSDCRSTRRDLLRRDNLPATAKRLVDVHMNRCDDCRNIYENLKAIEALPAAVPELTQSQERAIYNGLVPVINEITNEIRDRQPSSLPEWMTRRRGLVLGFVGATACLTLMLMLIFRGTDRSSTLSERSSDTIVAVREVPLRSVVDRHEGTVVIDGEDVAPKERFTVQRGTYIETGDSSRFSFHLGDLARVALFGGTKWELTSLSEDFIGITLDQGRLAVSFNGNLGMTMEIDTPDSLVRVKGTVFTVDVLESRGTEVGVIEGNVEVISHSGTPERFEVVEGLLGRIPGNGKLEPLTDQHRTLAAEMRISPYPEELTKLVRFDGSPERVKVEVNGRVLGTTPLAVRLLDAPFAYKLTTPGMEPVSGNVVDHRHNGQVDFLLVPEEKFDPLPDEAMEPERRRAGSIRSVRIKNRPKKRKWNLFNRARSAMRAGDLPYAIGLLEKTIVDIEKERRAGALSMLAESYAAAGIYGKAANTYDRLTVVSGDPAVVQNARYEVGRLSMDQLGDLSRARAAFTAYVAAPEGGGLREEAYYSLCEIDGREGAHRDALHCFNQFVRSFPRGSNQADARLWRGALYQDVQKEWRKAESDLSYFIRSKPHHPRSDEARYRLIIGRYQLGDRKGALRMIDQYMEKHPTGQYRIRVERIRRAVRDSSFTPRNPSK